MISRSVEGKVKYYLKKYPIVTITGPRQSGKTTLLRHSFPSYRYISFEDPDNLLLAKEDPRLFLKQYDNRVIIDEAQRFPELFSYLQTRVDNEGKEGMYILSGSHNFLLMERISQTLAGRTAIIKLLPFSYLELKGKVNVNTGIDELIHTGGYPRRNRGGSSGSGR